MINTSLIKDPETKKAINEIIKKLNRIESVPQLAEDVTHKKLVEWVNTITDSIKRKR